MEIFKSIHTDGLNRGTRAFDIGTICKLDPSISKQMARQWKVPFGGTFLIVGFAHNPYSPPNEVGKYNIAEITYEWEGRKVTDTIWMGFIEPIAHRPNLNVFEEVEGL